jgi:hypothetical protein
MPLHDWTDHRGCDSVHPLWIHALLFWVQDRLPPRYRAYLGSVPGLAIATEPGKPDRGVRTWQPPGPETPAARSEALVEALAAELQCQFPVGLPPQAVSWNVGGPTPEGGQFLDGWYRSLTVGQPLPTLPLVLAAPKSLPIDLEHTYAAAARRAYLE